MKKRVVAMSGQERPWLNYELAKDCGLIPYLLMRNHGCDVSMVCGGNEEYPYLDIMDGFKVDRLKDNSIESKVEYLMTHGKDIDLVIFHGITGHNIVMAEALRNADYKGLVACALDMNPDYADRIPFHLSPFYEYISNMDLMWQADSKMAEFLNEKWYWKVECATYGYYNLVDKTSEVDYYPFDKRENTLLYVGRVNDEQKHMGMLLRAYAEIANDFPEWKLKVVGPVEEPFGDYIDEFFRINKDLKERVKFTGNIIDRTALHQEYEKAKVFVTTTRYEGGTPNAMSEAVCSGCVIATTKILAYKDIIGENEAGMCSEIEDEKGFSDMLRVLLGSCDLEKMSQAAYDRGKKIYNLERTVEDIYGKLCAKGF